MISPYSRYSIILAIAVSTILQRALASSGNKYQNYQDWEYQYNSNHASNGDEYYNDDGGKADEAAVNGYYNDDQNPYENNKDTYEEGGDYIKYWTEYAILPKKCIV